jgi:hypothetical protein
MEEKLNPDHQLTTATSRLLLELKPGEVVTSSRLRALGVSERLTSYLKQRAILHSLGVGAYVRGLDKPHFASALQALTDQLKLPLHLGGRTALNILGVSQYMTLGNGQNIWLFSSQKLKLPAWFTKSQWKSEPNLVQTHFLNPELKDTIRSEDTDGFHVQVSTRERAILEAIFLIGKTHRFEEIDDLFESLGTLDAICLQVLLENCHSIRVCRIFLYLAHKHGSVWLKKLDESRIALGRGKRVVVKNGRLDSRYQITVPREG